MEATQPRGLRSTALLGPIAEARPWPGEQGGWRGGHGEAASRLCCGLGISPAVPSLGEREAKWLLGSQCWGRRGSVTY